MEKKQKIDPRNLMAVERATTSLIGTSISLIALGFVIEKFELFLYLVSAQLKSKHIESSIKFTNMQFYNYLGIAIVIVGIFLALYTYRYYTKWICHLEKGEIDTDKKIYLLLAIFIAIVGVLEIPCQSARIKIKKGLTMERVDFDFEEIVKEFRKGKKLTGKDGLLAPLIKQLVESALEAEIESHIANDVLVGKKNRRNGYNKKRIKGLGEGSFELETPRDREGTFEPQIVKKYQTTISDEIEEKILSMYALGMSYKDIATHIEEIYQIDISTATISAITDKIISKVKEWQGRPLEPIYPFVWLDAIHYKIKEGGKYITKAVYTILGVRLDGKKEVLGLYLSENESANFWLSVLTDLQARGVEDILIASVDGLKGFPEAINTIFPKTEVQLCIVHQIRNSLRYVVSKDQKEFAKDLKLIYQAPTKEIAEEELLKLEEKWGKKYPLVINSWQSKWENLSVYFKYPKDIRRIVYTTNIIESVHRQFRKLTKTKGAFPSETSLTKLLYLGIQNAQKKWTMPIRNWSLTLSQLAIFFERRLDKYLEV